MSNQSIIRVVLPSGDHIWYILLWLHRDETAAIALAVVAKQACYTEASQVLLPRYNVLYKCVIF